MDISKLIEMKISSQGLVKNGWKLIKKFKDFKNHYYALIECTECGNQELVNYYNFTSSRKKHPCRACKSGYKSLIGKIYGPFEILDIDHVNKTDTGQYQVYVKTKCTQCKNVSIMLFCSTDWKRQTKCKKCLGLGTPYLNSILRGYKDGAKSRNISWNLSNNDFLNLISSNCFYCGSKPEKHIRYKTIGYSNGIDRIDSNLDYNISNCVPCCTKCNIMKLNYPIKDFLEHINKIFQYQQTKQGSTTIENTEKSESE